MRPMFFAKWRLLSGSVLQGTRGMLLASRGTSLSLRDREAGASSEMVSHHCERRKRFFLAGTWSAGSARPLAWASLFRVTLVPGKFLPDPHYFPLSNSRRRQCHLSRRNLHHPSLTPLRHRNTLRWSGACDEKHPSHCLPCPSCFCFLLLRSRRTAPPPRRRRKAWHRLLPDFLRSR